MDLTALLSERDNLLRVINKIRLDAGAISVSTISRFQREIAGDILRRCAAINGDER